MSEPTKNPLFDGLKKFLEADALNKAKEEQQRLEQKKLAQAIREDAMKRFICYFLDAQQEATKNQKSTFQVDISILDKDQVEQIKTWIAEIPEISAKFGHCLTGSRGEDEIPVVIVSIKDFSLIFRHQTSL